MKKTLQDSWTQGILFQPSETAKWAGKEARSKKFASFGRETDKKQIKIQLEPPNPSVRSRKEKFSGLKYDLLDLRTFVSTAGPSQSLKKVRNVPEFDSSFKATDLRQTKSILKNGSQGLNLLRLVKLAALFAVCNLLTYCRASCPGPATVPTQLNAFTSISDSRSQKLETRGYSLRGAKIWKTTTDKDDKTISGI